MSIIINTNAPGQVGIIPRIIEIETTDNLATITTTGYLNKFVQNGLIISNQDMALVYGTDLANSAPGTDFFQVQVVGSNTSLVLFTALVDPFSVTLPTIANHIAVYTDTAGTISEDAATAINGGNIQAGLVSGTAGSLISYSGSASKGSVKLTAVANTNNTDVTISNVAMGQASVVSLPDPGTTTTNFIMDSTASGSQNIRTHVLVTGVHNIITTQGGNVQAGSSGAAGFLKSFPATATRGNLAITAVSNAADYTVTISNESYAQASIISFVDVGSAAGVFLVAGTSAPFVNGNIPAASGSTGLMIDSGIPTASLAISSLASPDAGSDLILKNITCTASALASAGTVSVQVSSGSKQYIVRDIFVNYSAAGLSGGGGDRGLQISDGASFTAGNITSALLQAPVNTRYSGSGNGFISTVAINSASAAGNSLYFHYTGGTADFTTGSVVISVLLQRSA